MEKVKTGIKGFDGLVDGGFPKGSVILLSGTPGTGKTIFALQYLYNGASKFNEKGIYITFEERADDLKKQASQFGWDIDGLEKKNMIKIMSIPSTSITKNTADEIMGVINKFGVKRLVIDSISTVSINLPSTNTLTNLEVAKFVYRFVDELKKIKEATTILVSQTISGDLFSRDTVSEFVCDGIVHILYEPMGGEYSRSLTVRKMRRTKNDEDIHPMEIGEMGIILHKIK